MENEMTDQRMVAKRKTDDQLEEKTDDQPEADESASDTDESEADEPVAEADPSEAVLHDKMFDHTLAELRCIPEDFLLDLLGKAAEVMGAMRASGVDYKEILRQPVSLHPSKGGESSMQTALNTCGYPLRPGENDCSYYVKSGRCKFCVDCKFNHPQPADIQVAAPGPGPYQQHVVPSDKYSGPVSPAASASTLPNVGASPVYGITQSSPQDPAYPGLVSSFPAPSGSSPLPDYFSDLPREVFLDILKRLPVKSIGVSRSVSKPWLSLLTNYDFIKAHLAHHAHLAQEQILLRSSDSLLSLTLHQSHGSDLREVEFNDEEVIDLVGACNGLVLVSTIGRVMWVINCVIEEIVKLPVSPFPLCPHLSFKKYGFGYDEVSDDYKIVKISQCDYGQSREPHCADAEIFVDIYSLKTKSWRRLGNSLYGHDVLHHDSCVFMNGAFHWIGLKNKYSPEESTVICSFDLSREKFKEFPAPASLNDDYNFLSANLMVIDGCVAIWFRPHGTQKTEIWLMKNYSVVESWTKLVVDFKPLCCRQDRILFKEEQDGAVKWYLKWYCVKDGSVEVCLVDDDGSLRLDEGLAYSDSLVSPHFNYHN